MSSLSGLAMKIMANHLDFKAPAHGLSVFMDSLTRVGGPGQDQGSNYVGGVAKMLEREENHLFLISLAHE